MKISLVTRTKNEAKELYDLGRILTLQSVQPLEVIVVDNNSEDNSRDVASEFGYKILTTDDYIPGKALNMGIEVAVGDFVAIVSSHCIPTNSDWLANLIAPFNSSNTIAGVYGRQLPTKASTADDYRDLFTVFGPEKKTQTKDIFFHNANSAIRRSIWQDIPFSNTATNIEDRIWAKAVLEANYKIFYNPDAAVFHPHGINHNGSQMRAARVVEVCKVQRLYEHQYDEDWFNKK